jgi:anti-sigma B factor antagonist
VSAPDEPRPSRPGTLSITRSQGPSGPVLELAGELDLATAPELAKAVAEAERLEGDTMVLDLRSLSFMDSSGLRGILLVDARLREAGRALALVRGPEAIDRVFELTGAERLVRFLD